jgi:uncharacterized membrane protein
MTTLGPVQLVTLGFGPDTQFEGRVLEELGALESSGQIRVLDVLFLQKDGEGDTVGLDYRAEGMGEMIEALLGLAPHFEEATGAEAGAVEEDGPAPKDVGFTPDDLRSLAQELLPGTAAGFVLLEHLWAKHLREAVREAGGLPLAEGFLTPEALAPVAAELLATTQTVDDLTAAQEAAGRPHDRPL